MSKQPSKEQILLSALRGIYALACSEFDTVKILNRIRMTCDQVLKQVS